MANEADVVYKAALRLSERERAELAGRLIDSLESEFDEDAEEVWEQEIARRLEISDSGNVVRVPWSQLKQKLQGSDDAAAAN